MCPKYTALWAQLLPVQCEWIEDLQALTLKLTADRNDLTNGGLLLLVFLLHHILTFPFEPRRSDCVKFNHSEYRTHMANIETQCSRLVLPKNSQLDGFAESHWVKTTWPPSGNADERCLSGHDHLPACSDSTFLWKPWLQAWELSHNVVYTHVMVSIHFRPSNLEANVKI